MDGHWGLSPAPLHPAREDLGSLPRLLVSRQPCLPRGTAGQGRGRSDAFTRLCEGQQLPPLKSRAPGSTCYPSGRGVGVGLVL